MALIPKAMTGSRLFFFNYCPSKLLLYVYYVKVVLLFQFLETMIALLLLLS
jgi:hypothetical protein